MPTQSDPTGDLSSTAIFGGMEPEMRQMFAKLPTGEDERGRLILRYIAVGAICALADWKMNQPDPGTAHSWLSSFWQRLEGGWTEDELRAEIADLENLPGRG